MNEHFIKIKKRCLIEALIKSAVAGIAAGLLVVGIFLLSFGLSEIDLHWAVYIAIGIVVAAACGGLAFLFLRPDDIKIAKRYDSEFALNERVQTMVEYSGKEGDIVALQREDTTERIKDLKTRPFAFSRIWQYCVLCVLAVAMLFTGVFVPAAAQNGDDTPPPIVQPEPDPDAFEYDLYMQAAMAELIGDVRKSSLKADDKQAVVTVLEALDGNLKEYKTKTRMKRAVISAVTSIDAVIDEANSFRKINAALEDENLSKAVMDGVAVFTASGSDFDTYRSVSAFEKRVGGYIEIVLEPLKETLNEDLKISQADGLGKKLNSFADAVNTALNNSGVDESDALHTAFASFIRALRLTADKVGKGSGDRVLWDEIDKAVENFSNDLNAALGVQSYYCVMDLFVRTRLSDIFGVTYSELPKVNEDLKGGSSSGGEVGGDDPEAPDDPENPSGGGGVGGNEIFGSDDVIYYPDAADYVKYGDVLQEYYEKAYDKILKGEASEELIKLIEEYFNILFSGTKDGSEEN